jgi:hypothetical protein
MMRSVFLLPLEDSRLLPDHEVLHGVSKRKAKNSVNSNFFPILLSLNMDPDSGGSTTMLACYASLNLYFLLKDIGRTKFYLVSQIKS